MLNLLFSLCLLNAPQEAPKPTSTAPAASPAVDPPRIKIAPPGRVDLGSLGPQELKAQTYTFTNTSAAPIALRTLDLSPGITVAGPALQAPIPPQGSATLTLNVDPSGWVGVQRRSVRFGTDDPKQGFYLLPVSFNVRADLTVDKDRKTWNAVAPHESPALSFSFRRETGAPTQLALVDPLPPHLELEQEVLKAAAGAPVFTELRFILRPDKLEPGVRRGLEVIKLSTNAPLQKEFTLYADWQVKWPVDAEPQRLTFLDPKQSRQTLLVKAADGKPVRLRSLRVEGSGFQVSPLPTQVASEHRLTVQRRASKATRTLLVIEVEGLDRPLKVPLAYLPPDPPAAK